MRRWIERPSAKGWALDAALYAVSALFAGVTAGAAAIPLQRSWGRAALWPYGIAALIAAVAAWSAAASGASERLHHRRRTILVLVVFAATALAPMAAAAVRRIDDPGAHAQSEVIIVEEAARAALHGHDPYAADYRDGPLSDRPAATQVHFPYLPAMLVFGVPRAAGGSFPWADARVWFAVAALVAACLGLARMRTAPDARIRLFQVLFALPTGALLLTTGGVDIPVIAMLLATAVFARSERPVAAGVAGGLALAAKQTSILILPFLVCTLPRGARRRFVLATGGVAAALIVPFAIWDVGAFVEDAILFPLNLGQGESAAATPTVGSVLLDLLPSHRTAVTVLLVAMVVGVIGLLLIRKRTPTMAQACARAAGAFFTAVALAPAARAGYLVYPINLIVWAIAFRGSEQAEV